MKPLGAYYNEIDPFAAAWLRELIKAGLIADGEIDERSITDVSADDVQGFAQCHFFAGIGGWSYALRLAGWDDARSVWTGSCPCQPFSTAGSKAGGNDARDLWPSWAQLIAECKPVVIFGEQVEGAIGHGWFDRVCDDLEAEDYAIGACGLPGPCVGAYDNRQRLWFVADTDTIGRERFSGARQIGTSECGGMDNAECEWRRRQSEYTDVEGASRLQPWRSGAGGFWDRAEGIHCGDGKMRFIEPGIRPLVDGVSGRVGRLRGYGNAIKPQVAQVFIESYMQIRGIAHD